ncbi:homoserine kinase [Enterococcus faecalis]
MRIRVPATSANLGPGFDSCGIALSSYLCIEVLGEAPVWEIHHSLGAEIASDEKNLLVQTALSVAPDLTPQVIKMTSDIPLARGLGSSSSAIVAGIELANRLAKLALTQQEKLQLATEIEGHPDNVAPAICGDFVVSSYVDGQVAYVKHHFPTCQVIAYLPDEPLLTSESRRVLPTELAHRKAVQNSSIANVMIAAVLNRDLQLAGKMMEKDQWHEPYRHKLVPHLTDIRQLAHQLGAYGTFLSGAGPTVLILAPGAKSEALVTALAQLPGKATIQIMDIDREGVQYF